MDILTGVVVSSIGGLHVRILWQVCKSVATIWVAQLLLTGYLLVELLVPC